MHGQSVWVALDVSLCFIWTGALTNPEKKGSKIVDSVRFRAGFRQGIPFLKAFRVTKKPCYMCTLGVEDFEQNGLTR